mmetsp:Transcript_58053/g.149450  ORF Transcript_58053/g.149450 Transcript_58053/m.149450 type:complete len:245 (+) Transcript_58053:370-1104(+)
MRRAGESTRVGGATTVVTKCGTAWLWQGPIGTRSEPAAEGTGERPREGTREALPEAHREGTGVATVATIGMAVTAVGAAITGMTTDAGASCPSATAARGGAATTKEGESSTGIRCGEGGAGAAAAASCSSFPTRASSFSYCLRSSSCFCRKLSWAPACSYFATAAAASQSSCALRALICCFRRLICTQLACSSVISCARSRCSTWMRKASFCCSATFRMCSLRASCSAWSAACSSSRPCPMFLR